MPASIPHSTPGPHGLDEAQEVCARVQRDDLLDLMRVIRDAFDVPSGNKRQDLLDTRAHLVSNTLCNVLDGSAVLGTAWETELLRQELADDTPRVTVAEKQVVVRRSLVRALRLRYFPGSGGRHA
jgi:hypothetical protein